MYCMHHDTVSCAWNYAHACVAGKDEYHKTAAAEARKILQAWECPGPKQDSKPVSPYWFAKS